MNVFENKIKNICVALDFSTYAKPILEYAVEIARSLPSRLTILHIINQKAIDSVKKQFESDLLEFFPVSEYMALEKSRCTNLLEALVHDCQADDIPYDIHIKEGAPSGEILKFLDKEAADLLVMGQKGRSDLPEYLFGTVAEKVFRHSPVPVLSLRF